MQPTKFGISSPANDSSQETRASHLRRVLRRRHLPALDGFRGVMVMLVVFYHAGFPLPGDLGVTGFFVLSGFLITWLLLQEDAATGRISLSRFYARRTLRIFPAYYVFVAVSMLIDAAIGGLEGIWSTQDIAAALTYTVNYRNALMGHDHPIAHAWSLAVEEQFYLLWPALFLMFHRRLNMRRWLALSIVVVVAWRSVLFLGAEFQSHYIYNAFDTRMDALAIGCLMAYLCKSESFHGIAGNLAKTWYSPFPTVALLYVSRVSIGRTWHYTVGLAVDAALLGVLLLQLMQLSDFRPWRWLNSRVAVRLGILSYPIYLWHLVGLGSADNILRGLGGREMELVLGIVLTYAAASCSYYFLEQPFLRLKGRFSVQRGETSGADRKAVGPSEAIAGGARESA